MTTFTAENFLNKFYSLRSDCFLKISGLSITRKLALALCMAGATGISAQMRFYLPWTPVPVTGQTLAVMLAGITLGARWGGISQALYLVLGMCGVPWFSGLSSGPAFMLGPTGGYIAGFIPAAFFIGWISERNPRMRCFLPMLPLMLFANFFLIHLPGLIHLSLWMRITGLADHSIRGALSAGTLPFIPGDISKIVIASLAAKILLPKKD